MLPPELVRKGRFDEVFFVDLPGLAERKAIFALQLKHRGLDQGQFDLAGLAAATEGWSGAEIEQAVPLSQTMRERVATLRAWAEGRAVPAS